MRIVLVNKFHWRKGGSETYYFGLVDGLRAAGYEVHCFAMEDERNEPCEDSDFFVSAKDYNDPTSLRAKVKAATSLIYSTEAKRKFQELCERVHPDVVHLNLVHRQITLSILDTPYLREHCVPVLFTAHDYILVCPNYLMLDGGGGVCDACLGGKFSNCLKRRCVKGSMATSALAVAEAEFLKATRAYEKIDYIIAPSEFMRFKLVEGGFPESQVVTMVNFAKPEVLAHARDAVDRTDREHPFLLFFGRLSREKGVDILMDAFFSIAEKLPDWRLVIAGEGSEREAIEAQIMTGSFGDRVDLVGFQSGESLNRLIGKATFAITPARWREVLGYSNMEALASGTPVICTDIGGMPELVADGKTGFLCNSNDVVSLADAIRRGVALWKDSAAYAAMQARCRTWVLENCDQAEYIERITALYEGAIEEKGRGR